MSAPTAPASTAAERPLATVRAFAAELWRAMPGRLAAAVALSLAVTAFEALGVLVLVQLLAIVGVAVPTGSAGALGEGVRRAFALVGARPTLAAVLVFYVAVMTAQALVQRAQTLASWRLELDVALGLRRRLYEAIAAARWLHFTRVRSSDLLAALTGECDRAGHAASHLLAILNNALVALVYLAMALRVSAGATLVALGCGALLLFGLHRRGSTASAAGQGLTRANAGVAAAASEHLQGMKVVKSHGAEERTVAIFAAAAGEATEMYLRAVRVYADTRALFTVGSMALLGIVTYVAVEGLALPAGVVILLVFFFARLVPRLQTLQQTQQYLLYELPAWSHLQGRLAALDAERERLAATTGVHALAEGVRFEGVRFAYPGAGRDAAAGLDLWIEARRTTAVVGPSGAGKTTVADLVMGLVRPHEGRVVVDGRVLDEGWLRGWREGIGYVSQDTVLFHDTVRANLLWARPGAGDDEVWEALRAAAADGFVGALPQGLDTVIGDRGVRLSGGERQRLALARALLRRPALLILDEATSALDTENERRIRDAIAALHGRVTILLITHRLSSVRDADVIHVLEAGRLVESGDWATLLAKPGGRFRDLWRSQEADDRAPEPAAEPTATGD